MVYVLVELSHYPVGQTMYVHMYRPTPKYYRSDVSVSFYFVVYIVILRKNAFIVVLICVFSLACTYP